MEKKMCAHLCLLSNSRPYQFLSFLISEFTLLCYYVILSHPLYLSYFVFFSPYLVKLLSFLSPLFITTSLLLLALLTAITPAHFVSSSPDSDKITSILLSSFYHALLEDHAKIDEFDRFEDFELYKMVFQESPMEFFDCTSTEGCEKSVLDSSVQEKDSATATVDLENSGEMEGNKVAVEEMDEFESKIWTDNMDRKKIEALDKKFFGSYGSMRKEKEWTRTLACKLYEERRHNNAIDSSSGEGMDLLWETYELDSVKSKVKRDNSTKKAKKKGESKRSYKKDEEEEDMNDEQLCCLQALNFSAGKMKFGMGRPNLVKISKAIRGFRWLHRVNRKKQGPL